MNSLRGLVYYAGSNPERVFGLTRDQIRDRYQDYVDKFSIRIEKGHSRTQSIDA